jgi:transcriptional regulator with XRE-family HTH domain
MLNNLSEELKEAREKAGITLQQIAAKTRIDLKFIENIESGNFSFLPELYLKAFIREYSKLVGLDDKIILKKFDAAKRGKAYDELGNAEDDIKKVKQEKEEIKPAKPQADISAFTPPFETYESTNQRPESLSGFAKNKNLLIGAAVGIVVIIVIIYFAFIKGSSDIIVSEKPYDEVQKENEQRIAQEAQKPPVSDSSLMSKSDSLLVTLDASDASWIKVLIDGNKSDEFTLYSNSHKEIKGLRNIKMTIGNSGAVQIKLNNKPLNFYGNRHEVKFVSIDSTGLQYVSSTPKP